MIAFVGLGPAGTELLPARALELLAQATVVIAEPKIAALIEPLAPTATMVEQAVEESDAEGSHAAWRHAGDAEPLVVRVVAGDASLRSRAEIRGVRALSPSPELEIVPTIGMESAIASYVGIDISTNVQMVKAHEVARLALDPATKLTTVTSLGTPRQIVRECVAREFVQEAAENEAIVVVGAHPDPRLRWFDRRPLFGKRVLVTRAREQAGELAKMLRERGAEPYLAPSIAIHPPPDERPLERALVDLAAGSYAWVAFTSANGVRRVAETLAHAGKDARVFAGAKIAAIGPGTARALNAIGLTADLAAKEFIGEALAAAIADHTASQGSAPIRVLLPRALVARDAAPDLLRARGLVVDVVPAYETRPPEPSERERLLADLPTVDAVTFTSSSTATNLVNLLRDEAEGKKAVSGHDAAKLLAHAKVVSIGPITTATCKTLGVRVDATARVFDLAGLVAALEESFAGERVR